MDFFGIIYDMKNGKKVPYSKTYFDTLFAAKLGGSDVKTLTGALPLTFTTSETALRSWIVYGNDFQQEESKSTHLPLSFYTDEDKLRNWIIYGNNYEHTYSATGTLPLTFTTHTAGAASDWEIEGNDEGVGERTVNLLGKSLFTDGISVSSTGEIITNKFRTATKDAINVNSSTAYLTWETDANKVECMVSGYDENDIYISRIFASPGAVINTSDYHKVRFTFYTNISMGAVEISEIDNLMFIEGSTPPLEYVPYGYQIPLTISQQGQPDKTVDIFIGDSPLTEGETVSKTSTGVDIAAQVGANTISTTLYNKPEMSITGVDYVGVGEPTNDGWQIPLTVSDGTNTTTVNVPIDAPLTASDTATRTSTGVDIPTYVGTNTISTTLENKPQMLAYYGYKGAGEHSGDTWEFNFNTSANGNQQLTKITMDKPLRAGETLTSEQAGVTIPTYANAENTLSLYPSAAGYGNPEMTIKFKE